MYECRLTFVVWIGTYKTNLFYTNPIKTDLANPILYCIISDHKRIDVK